MRLLKFNLLIVLVVFTCAKVAMAFEVKENCNQPLINLALETINGKKVNDELIQGLFSEYNTKGKWNENGGYYSLCFDPEKNKSVTTSFAIASQSDTNGNPIPLLIYGLNITSSASPAIQVTSANVTLHTIKATGPDTGTGIKIDAKDVTIDNATISKFATAIETTSNSENVSVKNSTISESSLLLAGKGHIINTVTIGGNGVGTGALITGNSHSIIGSTIQNFATGIQVGNATTVGEDITITGGTITNVNTGINLTNAGSVKVGDVTFTVKIGGHDILPSYVFDTVGKRCDKTLKSADGQYDICDTSDTSNKILKIAGKSPIGTAECNTDMQVEIYKLSLDYTKQYVMSCGFSQDINGKIIANQQAIDIFKSDCIFACEFSDGALTLADKILIKYKTDKNTTATDGVLKFNDSGAYYQTTHFSNLPDLFSTGLGGIALIGTGSGMGGEDDGTDPGAGDDKLLVETGIPPEDKTLTQTAGGSGEGDVGPGASGAASLSAGCSLVETGSIHPVHLLWPLVSLLILSLLPFLFRIPESGLGYVRKTEHCK